MSQAADDLIQATYDYIRKKIPDGMNEQHQLVVQAAGAWKRTSANATREKLVALMPPPEQLMADNLRQLQCARILLMCAIAKKETEWDGEAAIGRSLKSDLDQWYKMTIEDCYDAVCSFTDIARANLELLKKQPLTFLQKYRLLVNGKAQSNVFPYGFYMEGGIYKLDCAIPSKGRVQVSALNVPATLYAGVADKPGQITATLSSSHPEAEMMLTTQFTGCCYCFSVKGGELAAAHIDPGGGMGRVSPYTGQDVSKALRDDGGFSNGNTGEFKAYGRAPNSDTFGYSQGAKQMIIVALKRGTTWEVYSQTLTGDVIDAKQIG